MPENEVLEIPIQTFIDQLVQFRKEINLVKENGSFRFILLSMVLVSRPKHGSLKIYG